MEQRKLNIERQTLNLWPETGKVLGLGRNSTFTAARLGQIPTIRIGKRLLVPRAALERLLARADSPSDGGRAA